MLAYRVFPYVPTASAGSPGHPLYEHRPQRGGRIDHPDYYTWYLAREASGACGETFGNIGQWSEDMFDVPFITGARRALGVFRLPDDLRICDLDDPAQLVTQQIRPTQVIIRNLAVTSAWGHRIWSQHDPAIAGRRWQAVQWWSYHRPVWRVLATWHPPDFDHVEPLDLTHPAIVDAAEALYRTL